MSIKDFLLKIKGNFSNSVFLLKHKSKIVFRADFFVAVVIILIAFSSFGLGRLSSLEGRKSPIIIEKNLSFPSVSDIKSPIKNLSDDKTNKTKEGSPKSFVASKFGTKYYLSWCGGVSRIKEGNKVWFVSEEEAKKAGFSPASNCKGL